VRIPAAHAGTHVAHRVTDDRDRVLQRGELRHGRRIGYGSGFISAGDDIDFDRGFIHRVRQQKIVRNRLVFALPKGHKTRDVPLTSSITARLRAHLEQCPSEERTRRAIDRVLGDDEPRPGDSPAASGGD
jgi:hypothetical protein